MAMSWISGKRRRNLLLAIAAAAMAAGVIVASVSANGGPRHTRSTLSHLARTRADRRSGRSAHAQTASERAIAARYLGLTRTQLRSELRSGQTLAQIANSTSGKSATGLIDALVSATQQAHAASVRNRVTLAVDGVRTAVGRSNAAGYLGVSVARLRQDLRSGRSLAQIAGDTSGKSATGLIDALVSAREAQVKAAVASGMLEQAVAGKYLSNLHQRITHEVDRTRRAPAG
jgi:hypothetical protein